MEPPGTIRARKIGTANSSRRPRTNSTFINDNRKNHHPNVSTFDKSVKMPVCTYSPSIFPISEYDFDDKNGRLPMAGGHIRLRRDMIMNRIIWANAINLDYRATSLSVRSRRWPRPRSRTDPFPNGFVCERVTPFGTLAPIFQSLLRKMRGPSARRQRRRGHPARIRTHG